MVNLTKNATILKKMKNEENTKNAFNISQLL